MTWRNAEGERRVRKLAGKKLWKLAIADIEGHINVGMIHVLDEPKLVSTFLEFYAVGDRPAVAEMDEYLQQLWRGQGDSTRKRIVSFWKRVHKNPEHRFKCLARSWAWRHPFLILDSVVEREGLESCRDRLLTQVHLEADGYDAALRASPVSAETDTAQRRLAFAVRAARKAVVARRAT
jgi:hypothetical protein